MHFSVIVRASLVAAALAVAALLALPARAQEPAPAGPHQQIPTLSVSASAEIGARPDRARITSGVVSEADTARAALDANSTAIADVIAALRDAGIEERDIQTSGFSVEPRYHYPEPRDGRNEPPRIIGYAVTNLVTVLVRDLAVLGPVLDRAVTVGANRIHGIDFEVSDADELLDEARAEAVANARRKAEVYGEAAGVELAGVLSISESTAHEPPRPMYARAMQADAAESVPIQPGEETLRVEVNVTWEIRQ